MAWGFSGKLGKTPPQYTGKNAPNVQTLTTSITQPSGVTSFNRAAITSADQNYLNQGVVDTRVVNVLNYLIAKHKYLNISHIISGYENMTVNPEADQLSANISAHHNGLAADLDTIDFVYKVYKADSACSAASDGLAGDILYYNDLNQVLLTLPCRGDIFDTTKVNTTWDGMPAQGIPILIAYQDAKPNNPHAGTLADPGLNLSGVDLQVYQTVLQPEARRKVHQIITELLQYPATTSDANNNRVTQLITYSQPRDVQPFITDGTLDKVYGAGRPNNYGLFAMEEAWQNIHIGY
jgi:hypothetical protein